MGEELDPDALADAVRELPALRACKCIALGGSRKSGVTDEKRVDGRSL